MEIREPDGDDVLLSLSADEVAGLVNMMREAMQAVEDWEFHTLVGLEKSEVIVMRDQLRRAFAEVHRPWA